jgi:hypothetical protein
MSRLLVYFVIGGDPTYVALLKHCVQTIRYYEENNDIDILVMCDASYVPNVSSLPVKIHVTPPNTDATMASLRRTEIYSVPQIYEYDKILYLDCDITVAGSLHPLFDAVTQQERLYVVPESSMENHATFYYSRADRPYDSNTLQMFAKEGILPFNSGQYAFINSPRMRAHFEHITSEIRHTYDPQLHFVDQPFLNDHFNRRNLVSYDISQWVSLCALNGTELPSFVKTVNHFTNFSLPWHYKLPYMKAYHECAIASRTCSSQR